MVYNEDNVLNFTVDDTVFRELENVKVIFGSLCCT